LTGVEVVTLSTDAQRSSSQQGINYFFRSNTLGKEKSFVVEVVAVDFAASSRLVSEKFPTNFHTQRGDNCVRKAFAGSEKRVKYAAADQAPRKV